MLFYKNFLRSKRKIQMSTKVTKHYGEKFHIYYDSFCEDKGIYIQLDKVKEFSVNYSKEEYSTLNLLLENDVWEDIKKKIIEQYEKEK